VAKAKYSWLLFLDCDTFPQHKNFIKKYLESTTNIHTDAVYGGIAYHRQKPNSEEMLRWVYGKKREEIVLERRIQHPFKHSLISNFLVRKVIIEKFPFDTNLFQYGYEDIVLIQELEKNSITIHQIENPAYHLQLENSAVFLEKTKHSLSNLKLLIDRKVFTDDNTSLVKTYQLISKMGLRRFVAFLFKNAEGFLTKNLLSKSPSLTLFLLYKLGYFCKLNSQ
jgi:hypothetical protein